MTDKKKESIKRHDPCSERYDAPVLDWLAFTLPVEYGLDRALEIIYSLFGEMTPSERGLKGYKQVFQLKSGGFVGHDSSRPEMGLHCVLPSGALGAYDLDPYSIIDVIYTEKGHVARFDIAFDDYDGFIDISEAERAIVADEIISRLRGVTRVISRNIQLVNYGHMDEEVELSRMTTGKRNGLFGSTLYIGSRKSDLFIRIYDKRVESGCIEMDHWVRVEISVKGKRARSMAPQLKDHSLQELLNGHISFREPREGIKKVEWPHAAWWSGFIETTKDDRITLPKPKRNYETIKNHIFTQAVKNIAALEAVEGEEILDEIIRTGRQKLYDDPHTLDIVNSEKERTKKRNENDATSIQIDTINGGDD